MIVRVIVCSLAAIFVFHYVSNLPEARSAVTVPTARASVAPSNIRIEVTANETTAYGTPWDGVRMGGIVGSVMPELPTSSPPDLAACVISLSDAGTAMDCYHDGTKERPASLCHDAFECSFDVSVPPRQAFGVVIVDLDGFLGEDRNDLVDAFVVAPRDGDAASVAEAVRAAVRELSKTDIALPKSVGAVLGRERVSVKPNEERRRSTALRTFERGECEGTPCRLSQSQVRIRWGG